MLQCALVALPIPEAPSLILIQRFQNAVDGPDGLEEPETAVAKRPPPMADNTNSAPQWWWYWSGLVTYLQPDGEVELLILTELGQLDQEDRQMTD